MASSHRRLAIRRDPPLAAGLSLLICSLFNTAATAEVVFDGSMLPEDQGWGVGASAFTLPAPFFTDGDVYTMNTIGLEPDPAVSALHLWSKDVEISLIAGFSIEISLRVVDDTVGHNQFDAPIAFLAGYSGGFGSPDERAQMLYFDENGIGWADDSASHAMNTTDGFHLYRLDVDSSGFAQVYVDGALAFTRTGFFTNGIIAFGDQTNDSFFGPEVDGHFQLERITVVPQPAVLSALVGILTISRRRRDVVPLLSRNARLSS